jgi:hypothetical protein
MNEATVGSGMAIPLLQLDHHARRRRGRFFLSVTEGEREYVECLSAELSRRAASYRFAFNKRADGD